MEIPEPPDYAIAADYLRTLASLQAKGTQAHKNFTAAADLLEGPKLAPFEFQGATVDPSFYMNLPVFWKEELAGHAAIVISINPWGVDVTGSFEYVEGFDHPKFVRSDDA